MGVQIEAKTRFSVDFLINGLSNSAAIQQAAARGLNEHIRLQERNAVNFLGAFTNQGSGRVAAVTKSVKAAPGAAMSALVVTKDKAIAAGEHTGRTWSRSAPGATHRDWKGQMLPRTFTVARWGGAIFQRKSSKRFPLQKIWGPILPNELRKESRPNVKRMRDFAERDVLPRVMRHVGAALMR
jgi:hypothetical protein